MHFSIGSLPLCVLALAVACDGSGMPGESVDPGKGDCTSCVAGLSDMLASNDRLRIYIERTNQRWLDQNISTGKGAIRSGRFAVDLSAEDDALAQAASELLREESREDIPDAAITHTDRDEFFADDFFIEDDVFQTIAQRVAQDGFAFSPEFKDGEAWFFWSTRHAVDWLATEGPITIVEATAEVDDGFGATDQHTLSLFWNPETNKFVTVYVREGTI